jgi:hypothetical protein
LAGFDEMDEVSGDGSAELFDDGTIEVEFAYRNGDEALLKASGRAICRAFRRRLAQTGPIEPAARAPVPLNTIEVSRLARCGSGMPANASRSRAGQRRHLLPYLLRTANGRILRLIF